MKWEEACVIFGVNTDASDQEIKEIYQYLVKTHHPDKHPLESEVFKKRAAEQFIRYQKAYDVLKDPRQRPIQESSQRARAEENQQPKTDTNQRPKTESSYGSKTGAQALEVFPPSIFFPNVEPGTILYHSFEIRYHGDSHNKPPFIHDDFLTNVKIVHAESLSANGYFPLKVDISAPGNDVGYVEYIPISFDGESVKLKVELQTKQEEKVYSQGTGKTGNTSKDSDVSYVSNTNATTWFRIGFTGAAFFLGIGLGYYFNVGFLSIVSTLILWVIECICLYYYWQNKHARIVLLILSIVPICSTLAILNPGFIVFQWYPVIRMIATHISSALGGATIAGVLTYFLIAEPLSNSKYRTLILLISFVIAVGAMVLGIKLAN